MTNTTEPMILGGEVASLSGSVDSAWLSGGGELGKLIRAFDWSTTSLGPLDHWAQSLRTATDILLRSPVAMVMLWGVDGTMIYNDAYSVFAGRRHPRLLGRKVREGWPEVATFNDHVMDVGLAGGTLTFKDQELTLYRTGIAEQVWMDLDYSPVMDEVGRPAGVLGIVIETTDRVRTRRQLTAERDRHRGVLDGMAEGFSLLDYDFRIIDVNAEALAMETRGRDEIVGRTHWEVYPGSEQSEPGRLYKRAMRDRTPVSLEHLYQWADGRSTWFEMRAYPVPDGLAVFHRDVSDRKLTEKALREREERLRLVVEGATDYAILTIDTERRITSWSSGAQATFGYRADEVVGQSADILFTPEDRVGGRPEIEIETTQRDGMCPDVR